MVRAFLLHGQQSSALSCPGLLYAHLSNLVATALLSFIGSICSAIIVQILGVLGDSFEINDYPERSGYILGTILLITFAGSCPLFLIAGHSYAKLLVKDEIEQRINNLGLK